MNVEQIELTPEMAAEFLANPHPKQRKQTGSVVAYARAMTDGRWKLTDDALKIAPDGRMFNGGHRCAAVIMSGVTIPMMLWRDADPDLFDVIDIGKRRSPAQFISEHDATARAAAARVTLWYQQAFDRPHGKSFAWDLHEILQEQDRRSASFDAVMAAARKTYEYTSIPMSVCLGAYALAEELGLQEAVESFVDGVVSPNELPKLDPRSQLADRFRKQDNRGRRRRLVDDWSILVRAFNLHGEGMSLRLQLTDFWPRIGESNADFAKRRNVNYQDTHKKLDPVSYKKKAG